MYLIRTKRGAAYTLNYHVGSREDLLIKHLVFENISAIICLPNPNRFKIFFFIGLPNRIPRKNNLSSFSLFLLYLPVILN